MNIFIKKELEKIKANMSYYDDSTTHIHIDKRSSNNNQVEDFEVGLKYRIMIEDYILEEPSNFTLSSNWNNGVKPVSKILEGTLKKIQGNMLQWDLVGFDENLQCEKSDKYIDLWLPKKSITVLGIYRLVI